MQKIDKNGEFYASEDVLQQQFMQYLAFKGLFAFHVPNGGVRDAKTGAKLKREGVVAGIPDIIILHNGKAYFVEVKTKIGALSTNQKAVHDRIKKEKFAVEVVRNIEELERLLQQWGILKNQL